MPAQEKRTVKRATIRFPLELFESIKKQAAIHRRSFTQELLWIAAQFLENK